MERSAACSLPTCARWTKIKSGAPGGPAAALLKLLPEQGFVRLRELDSFLLSELRHIRSSTFSLRYSFGKRVRGFPFSVLLPTVCKGGGREARG